MKGLLAGRITRDHTFADGDSRPGYEVFQGQARQRTHDILDRMKVIADQCGLTIAQLSIGWTLSQPGVTSALIGARRPEQIRETSSAQPLSDEIVQQIDAIVQDCL